MSQVGFGRQTDHPYGERDVSDDMMSLRSLLENSSTADLLREMMGFAAQRLMELEVESLTSAGHGERSPERVNHRNGYRDRAATGYGRPVPALSTAHPEIAPRQLFPGLLDKAA
jgi:hypothetical protein